MILKLTVRTPKGPADARALITRAQFALSGVREDATMADFRNGTAVARKPNAAQVAMLQHLEEKYGDLDTPDLLPHDWRRQLRATLEEAAALL